MELPEYTIRPSARATRVVLSIRPRQGLEVVVPMGYDPSRVPDIVRRRLSWVRKHLSRLADSPADAPEAGSLPDILHFQAAGVAYPLAYVAKPTRGVRLVENAGRVLLAGKVEDLAACHATLRGFVRRKAAAVLPGMLADLAGRTNLSYEAARVRMQRSRWGSCSAANVINLNAKLLFLPAHLAEHVLLHELCHTRHHHHRATFWKLVERFSPDWRDMERELRQAWRHVPGWVDGDCLSQQDERGSLCGPGDSRTGQKNNKNK